MQNHTTLQNTALLILRIGIAVIFLYAAYAKLGVWSGTLEGVTGGMAVLMKFLSIVEPLGALALLFGFLTRWAAGGLAIIMVGAIAMMQFVMGIGFFTMPQVVGWDYNFLILSGCVALIAFGAGDWRIGRKDNEPIAA